MISTDVESTKVKGANSEVDVKIDPFTTSKILLSNRKDCRRAYALIGVRSMTRLIEKAFVAKSNEMVFIDGLDICGDLLGPCSDSSRSARARSCSAQGLTQRIVKKKVQN